MRRRSYFFGAVRTIFRPQKEVGDEHVELHPRQQVRQRSCHFPVAQESEQHSLTRQEEIHRRYRVDGETWLVLVLSICKLKIRHGRGHGGPPLNGQVGAQSDLCLRGFRLRAIAIPVWVLGGGVNTASHRAHSSRCHHVCVGSSVSWVSCMLVSLKIIFYRHFWMWTPHLFVRAQTHIFFSCVYHSAYSTALFQCGHTAWTQGKKNVCSAFLCIRFHLVCHVFVRWSVDYFGHVFTDMFCVKTLSVLKFAGFRHWRGMSGCLANPTPNTGYEEEETPINLLDRHRSLPPKFPAQRNQEVFCIQEHPPSARKPQ